MLVLEDDLTGLAAGVWEAFLGLSVDPAGPDALVDGPTLTTSVSISGGWNGSVSLVFPTALAGILAGAMFGMDQDEISEDEVNDAVGELANIIGGNIKGMIEDPCTLSLPMVARGSDYSVTVPGTTLQKEVHLHSEGHVFYVAVHNQS